MIKSIFCVESSKTHLHWKFYYASKSERNVKCFSIVSFKAPSPRCVIMHNSGIWMYPPLPLSLSLLLSTLIWEIFLQIFNIFLLQLFHEENHEILRSWRHQWGPGSDHMGGAEKEDRHQEVGRSQGITRQRHNPIICFQSWPHSYREDTFLSYWFSCFPNA